MILSDRANGGKQAGAPFIHAGRTPGPWGVVAYYAADWRLADARFELLNWNQLLETSGAEALQVERDIREAQLSEALDNLTAQVRLADLAQCLGGNLQPRQVVVVAANSNRRQAEAAQQLLGSVDSSETLRRDFQSIDDAARKARRCRFVPDFQTPAACHLANFIFADAAFCQRVNHPVI